MPNPPPEVLPIFELCNSTAEHYIKSQSFLFRVIQQRKDSINVSQGIIDNNGSSPNAKIENEFERVNLINNDIDEGRFQEALAKCNAAATQVPLIQAKKLEVLYRMKKTEEVDRLLSEL